jgi:hypothetical protein
MREKHGDAMQKPGAALLGRMVGPTGQMNQPGVVTLNNHKEQLIEIDAVKAERIPTRVQPYLVAKAQT